MRKSSSKRPSQRSAREVALDVLLRVVEHQAFSPLALQAELEQAQLNDADRGLVTELVYGTLQWQGWLDQQLEPLASKGLAALQKWVLILLRISIYQMTRLDRIPVHAAVNEAVNLAKKRGHEGIVKLVNGILRAWLRRRDAQSSARSEAIEGTSASVTTLSDQSPARHAQPEWIFRRWMRHWGEAEALRIAEASLGRAGVTVRVNTRRTEAADASRQLTEHDYVVVPSPLSADGLRISGKQPIQHHRLFHQGMVTIQDDSSMMVADAVSPTPGMMILDACSAPGGKTTHMAQRLNGQGTVWALDQHAHKEALIMDNVTRLELTDVVKTKIVDAREAASMFPAKSFDAVLLDAPCSGSGVFRRKPERKWRPEKDARKELEQLIQLQAELLEALVPLVKPGGVFVYSTCSIDREENDAQVSRFLNNHPDFQLDEQLLTLLHSGEESSGWRESSAKRGLPNGMIQLLPHDADSDGFFIARMRRL